MSATFMPSSPSVPDTLKRSRLIATASAELEHRRVAVRRPILWGEALEEFLRLDVGHLDSGSAEPGGASGLSYGHQRLIELVLRDEVFFFKQKTAYEIHR